MPIHLVRGDITRFAADAIVNAANPELLPGGGVSGAIHHAAGPALAQECVLVSRWHGLVSAGEAVATGAGNLAGARRVIHAVGPVWRGGTMNEPELLADAYRSAIEAADELELASIAFPSISTGVYGYPVDLAAPVALRSVAVSLERATHVHDATFVLYDEATFEAFRRADAARSRELH
ncbi:MAG: macro domain-containing protein [Coriobacteriia bacterium]|nr:macro domain-containing protein [Coriobacteriia bacterium]